jgi:deoxyribodipyrimidine photo-lyase
MPKTFQTGLFWFRRDLRANDNVGLHRALSQCERVHCVFVLDTDILDALPRQDRRVEFIVQSLRQLDGDLRSHAGRAACGLIVRHGRARHEVVQLAQTLGVQAVFSNHDDEPDALRRDNDVRTALTLQGREFFSFKDHVIFERRQILTQAGSVYGVFTPYKAAWLKKITDAELAAHAIEPLAGALADRPEGMRTEPPGLEEIGFESTNLNQLRLPPGSAGAHSLLQDFQPRLAAYGQSRDFPAQKGPSYLGVHLRFGTVSIRHLVGLARRAVQDGMAAGQDSSGAATWLSELIWRDFYAQILANHPLVEKYSFKPEYDSIAWRKGPEAEADFRAWCQGQTGYPLVDAAMAQINQTGYMHNRLRMVVASFLVKDLGIDWRWGEGYFAQHLNDFDLASNNGGWQWASSSGCDAQPYFRIFNPVSQSQKFDPEGRFIRRYLPQLARLPTPALHAPWLARPLELQSAGVVLGQTYPMPMVQHDEARQQTLLRYAVVKKRAGPESSTS